MSWGTHDAESREARLETIVLLLGSLASVKVNDARLDLISPRDRQQGTFDSLRAFLVGESQRQPVVVVLDDLQWIDTTSHELLKHLVGSVAGHRLLLVTCARPEYQPGWSQHSAVVPLALKALDERERRALMEHALRASHLEPDLVGLASERSEGNPFLLEELLNALVERSAIVRDGDACRLEPGDASRIIPDTVEDLIMARIDGLDAPWKHVLQTAAVIGRDFSFDLLRAVAGGDDELRQSLMRLADLELIRETAIFPTWEFSFKNSLTQEVAYRGLLASHRRELHERVARAMETLSEDRLEETYEVLAHHLSLSANAERAVHYLMLAGEKAVKHFAIAEARRYYDEAAEKLQRLPEAQASRRGRQLHHQRERLAAAQAEPR